MTTYAVTALNYDGSRTIRLVDASGPKWAALQVKVIRGVARVVRVERMA